VGGQQDLAVLLER